MIKDSLKALGNSARDALRGWRGLLLLNVLYLVMLACVYYFFAVGVATAGQLVVSALTALAAPLLFFVLQSAVVNFVQPDVTFGALIWRTLRDLLKVLLLALPLIALAVGVIYALGWVQAHLPKIEEAPHVALAAHAEPPSPFHWQDGLISSLWLVLLGIFIPLVTVHLWLSTARDGLLPTLKRIHRVIARAFSGQSLLIYTVGLFVFGLMPYFVLYTRTSVTNGWAELTLFGLRLALAFVLSLWGWTITLGALARTTTPADASAVEVPTAEEAPAPVQNAA